MSRSRDRRAGTAEPGHTPYPSPGAASPKPAAEPAAREPAPAVMVTCCGAARSPGRPPARDPEGLVLRWPPAGSAAGTGVGGAAGGRVAVHLGAGVLRGEIPDGSDQTLAKPGYLSANIRNSIAVSD